jgi:hypothetical protein
LADGRRGGLRLFTALGFKIRKVIKNKEGEFQNLKFSLFILVLSHDVKSLGVKSDEDKEKDGKR